jgi:anti-sigma regulatory factor (Ser/Thr protein kinase)
MAGLEACLDFDSDPARVRLARSFVARTLRKWKLGALVDDAQLVVSELASNAVLHSGGEVRVTLRSDGKSWVRIGLRDDNPLLPVPGTFSYDATSGRGLSMVEALSTRWGVGREGRGKTVWAELAVGDARASVPDCMEAHDVGSSVT